MRGIIAIMLSDWTGRNARRQGRCMSPLLWLLALLLGAGTAQAAAISGVDLLADSIVLRFDDPVRNASAFLLDGPQRIAVDVGGARPGSGGGAGGFVARTRQGQFDPSTARVVFDLAQPAVIASGQLAENGRSLTLSLKQVSELSFSNAVRAGRKLFGQPPITASNSVTIPLDPPRAAASAPTPPVIGARGSRRPLVVIDPGHGGHDPGSISPDGRWQEKDVALRIARAIRDELVASGRVRVAMTRDDDRFLVLGERREIGRRLGADLFISVHADSAANPLARGATVYTLSEVASDRVAAQLAAKENKADILNGVDLGGENNDVSSILIDLAQRETMNVSSGFAALLQREMSPTIPFRTTFHRFAGLIVLKAPDVPSVLLETGYMSNPDDLALLLSPQYRRNIAVGVRKAVETHFARQLAER
jgi:N-acetylmuramoyl-L-alanine amidase